MFDVTGATEQERLELRSLTYRCHRTMQQAFGQGDNRLNATDEEDAVIGELFSILLIIASVLAAGGIAAFWMPFS